MFYIVPGMRLIPQDKNMSCWYASGQMIIEWRREKTRSSELAHPDPSEVARWQKLYTDNTGITNAKILQYARDLGLKAVPPMSPSPQALERWLRTYGPLWVNGVAHITVIAGIRDTTGEVEVLVYDPAKPTAPTGEWRSLETWYSIDAHSGRDTSAAVETVFLHAPL